MLLTGLLPAFRLLKKTNKKKQQRDEFLEAFLQLQTQPRVVLYHNTALGP